MKTQGRIIAERASVTRKFSDETFNLSLTYKAHMSQSFFTKKNVRRVERSKIWIHDSSCCFRHDESFVFQNIAKRKVFPSVELNIMRVSLAMKNLRDPRTFCVLLKTILLVYELKRDLSQVIQLHLRLKLSSSAKPCPRPPWRQSSRCKTF